MQLVFAWHFQAVQVLIFHYAHAIHDLLQDRYDNCCVNDNLEWMSMESGRSVFLAFLNETITMIRGITKSIASMRICSKLKHTNFIIGLKFLNHRRYKAFPIGETQQATIKIMPSQ